MECIKTDRPATWGWSVEGDPDLLFQFDDKTLTAVWCGIRFPLNWPKEWEKLLN